ncbi:MAG: SOS response-associated peptidase [Suipraeoptans sp.]
MCARFLRLEEVIAILWEWNKKTGVWLTPEDFQKKMKDGTILPTDYTAVFVRHDNEVLPEAMRWGLRRDWTKTPIINTRIESVTEKPTYKNMISLQNRVVVPSAGFIEYAKTELDGKVKKVPFTFKEPHEKKLYMAGLYEHTGDGDIFTILTTEANASVEQVHDRMPVVLSKEESTKWLSGKLSFEDISDREKVNLDRFAS